MSEWKQGDQMKLGLTFAADDDDDIEKGVIKGIASTPTTDLYGHRVMKGAFDESIARKGLNGAKGVKLLAGHDWDKIIGNITKLKTVGKELRIEAEMFLDVGWIKDYYTVTKRVGGLNFSVGFTLDEFELLDEPTKDGADLIIKSGDLMEVSVVAFPAQPEATMTYIKSHETMSALEKALVANGYCQSRSEAHKLSAYMKANTHLFLDRPAPSVPKSKPAHPLLDAESLKPLMDYAAKCRQLLGT